MLPWSPQRAAIEGMAAFGFYDSVGRFSCIRAVIDAKRCILFMNLGHEKIKADKARQNILIVMHAKVIKKL